MRKVLVLGDVILDQTTHVRVKGISPESDHVLAVTPGEVTYNPGGAANVAMGVKALGVEPVLLGLTGRDEASAKLVSLLVKARVSAQFDYWEGGVTTKRERIVTPSGTLLRVDTERPGNLPPGYWAGATPVPSRFAAELFDATAADPVVCLVDHDRGFFAESSEWIMSTLRRHKPDATLIVDPGRCGHWNRFGSPSTVFKANLRQAVAHYEAIRDRVSATPPLPGREPPSVDSVYPDQVYVDALMAVKRNLNQYGTEFKYLVLTFGAGGIGLVWPYGPPIRFTGEPVQVADPCGAGDTVMATLAAMAAGKSEFNYDRVKMACAAAHAAASKAVQKRGVYVVSREEVEVPVCDLVASLTTTDSSPTGGSPPSRG